MQNLFDVGRREGSLRREGIFRYFFVFFFVFLLTPTGHARRPITTIYGSQRVFPRKVWPFGGLDMGVGTRGAEGAAAPPTFGTGEQAIALAPPKV